jgi:hypothetical protein
LFSQLGCMQSYATVQSTEFDENNIQQATELHTVQHSLNQWTKIINTTWLARQLDLMRLTTHKLMELWHTPNKVNEFQLMYISIKLKWTLWDLTHNNTGLKGVHVWDRKYSVFLVVSNQNTPQFKWLGDLCLGYEFWKHRSLLKCGWLVGCLLFYVPL